MVLRWDGSQLSDWQIVQKHSEKNFKWLQLKIDELQYRAGYRVISREELSACVVDEICKALRIPAVGTHWGTFKGKIYYLYQIPDPGEVQILTDVPDLHTKPLFRCTLQKLLMVRELMRAPVTLWSVFQVRNVDGYSVPISTFAKIKLDKGRTKVITIKAMEKWLDSYDHTAKILWNCLGRFECPVLEFQTLLETIIERVDPELETYIQPLMTVFADFWRTIPK